MTITIDGSVLKFVFMTLWIILGAFSIFVSLFFMEDKSERIIATVFTILCLGSAAMLYGN